MTAGRNGLDILNEGMWASFVLWALDQPEFRKGYEDATGAKFVVEAKNPISRAIDRACGVVEANRQYVEGFSHWVTEHHWGMDFAPEKFRREHERRKATPK
jgi:hypothetical protein